MFLTLCWLALPDNGVVDWKEIIRLTVKHATLKHNIQFASVHQKQTLA